MLWDRDLQIQEYSDTHVYTTIYDQDSFKPVARLMWLRDDMPQPINDEPIIKQDNPHLPVEVELKSNIQVYHYHNDQLGTPNEMTNEKGEVVWLADYEAWSNTAKVVWREEKLEQLQVSVDELQPIRFQGQSFDTETGLHYNRFRYFDPDLGMFTARDPIGLMGGDNVFAYAPNPTGFIDPLGLITGAYNYDPRTYGEAAWNEFVRKIKENPVSKYIGSLRNSTEGLNAEVEAGGTLVAILGVSQTSGVAVDTNKKSCITVTTCVLLGPMIGAYSHSGGSVSTGVLTRGSRAWQLTGTGTATIGTGGALGASVNSDGTFTASGELTAGAAAGAALKLCSKKVTNQCTGL